MSVPNLSRSTSEKLAATSSGSHELVQDATGDVRRRGSNVTDDDDDDETQKCRQCTHSTTATADPPDGPAVV